MRIKDWGHIVSVLGVCLLLICGCDGRSDEGLSSDGPDAVYLDINVALRDAPVLFPDARMRILRMIK